MQFQFMSAENKKKKNLVNSVGCKIVTQLVHKQCGHYNQTNYGYCNKNNNAKINIKFKKKSQTNN